MFVGWRKYSATSYQQFIEFSHESRKRNVANLLTRKGNLALSQDGASRKANTSVKEHFLRKRKMIRDGDGLDHSSCKRSANLIRNCDLSKPQKGVLLLSLKGFFKRFF